MSVVTWDLVSEEQLGGVVNAAVRIVEAAGAAVIFIGAVIAAVKFVRALVAHSPDAFVPVRLSLGRFLALGLEFQLASDVLRTAVAPSFEELGKLAAVAAIRTALNFFLSREIEEERRVVEDGAAHGPSDAAAHGPSDAAGDRSQPLPGP
ncbi:DUF1622 domain-containing protein [Flexivirga sp.]|uniref:DUF1622 domain-containing protein n=1 Tax=Flexivirga sp. TaxID=1962927 RepID=UPI003F7DEC79